MGPNVYHRLVAGLAGLLVAAMVVLAAPPAGAQDEVEPGTDETLQGRDEELIVDTVRRDKETGEVEAEVVVPVKLSLSEIEPESVTVVVGNERPDVTFEAISSDNLEVVLVIDISGSMKGAPLDAAKAAASSFVQQLPPGVGIAVVAFDQKATTVAERSATRDETLQAINSLAVGGDTALFDALVLAESLFSEAEGTKRVLVALTDGGDSASTASLEQARDALLAGNVEPFAVALATSETATGNLEDVVAGTSGRVERTDSVDALLPLYNDLANQLANRFVIRFTPDGNAAGSALVLVNTEVLLAGTEVRFLRASVPPAIDGGAERPPPDAAAIAAENIRRNPPVQVSISESWRMSSTVKTAGIAALAATFFLVGLLLSFPSERVTLLTERGRNTISGGGTQVGNLAGQLEHAAERVLGRNGRGRRLSRALERAGWALRPAEFVVIACSYAIVQALLTGLRFGVVLGVLSFIWAYFLARMSLSYRASKRKKQFVEQLPATLQLMAGGLRAGYALPQATEHIANETDSPTSDEFHRLTTEHRLGRDYGDALHALADRIESDDFTWVVHAIDIHREVGGDLAEVLDNVHATMLDRNFVRRQFAAVSAEGRYSGYLIVSLPFVVAAIMAITNPNYIGQLVADTRGFVALALAFVLITTGSLWMRSLMKVRF